MAKKTANKRPSQYEKKVAITGSFADVIKVSVTPPTKRVPVKKKAKKKK